MTRVPTTAVVIGNGVSRLCYDLWQLKNYNVVTYGCNFLYRDFAPDWMVAIDDKMIHELRTEWVFARLLWTTGERQCILQGTDSLCNLPGPYGYDSGRLAITAAVAHGATTVYLLGFDFFDKDPAVDNNVYPGDRAHAGRPVNYSTTWNSLFGKHGDVRFVRVGPKDDEFLGELNRVELQDYEEFARDIDALAKEGNSRQHRV